MDKKIHCGRCEVSVAESIYMTLPVVKKGSGGSCFVNESLDICRQIVDPWGNIRNFPGVQTHPMLTKECPRFTVEGMVRHVLRFGPVENGEIPVLWTIRPEYFDPGDEWGFGREEIEEVVLASALNETGDFTGPFRLYRIGKEQF